MSEKLLVLLIASKVRPSFVRVVHSRLNGQLDVCPRQMVRRLMVSVRLTIVVYPHEPSARPRMVQMAYLLAGFDSVSFAPGDLLLRRKHKQSHLDRIACNTRLPPSTLDPAHHARFCFTTFACRVICVPPDKPTAFATEEQAQVQIQTTHQSQRLPPLPAWCRFRARYIPPLLLRLALHPSIAIAIAMHSRSMADHALRDTELWRRPDQEETRSASQPVSRRLLHLP